MNILSDFYINFDELKEGDVLYDIALQSNMTIRHIFKNDKYAIVTKNLDSITYMKDGRRYDSDTHPRLLKANPFDFINTDISVFTEVVDNQLDNNIDRKNIYL